MAEKYHINGSSLVFLIQIETVGRAYPVAFHVELNAGEKVCDEYENSILGFCSKDDLSDQLKKCIKVLVEQFAITFFKVRGEL